jgi:hypothetical protein
MAKESIASRKMWGIAPADGGGWCECEKCRSLDEKCDWPGARMYNNKSLTPRIIAFCNETAKRIKAKQPDKILGCFAYAAYTYPPEKSAPLESNIFIMLASRPYYGYGLYRGDMQKEFARLIESWSALVPGRLGWFDFSTYTGLSRCSVGAPYPPGIKILKTVFPTLKKHNVKDIFWAIQLPRSHGAVNAYIVTKLMWRADADIDALAKEWTDRAYGPGGASMLKLYELLEEKTAEYKNSAPDFYQYRCTPDQIRKIHLPIFSKMEELYKEALAKAETDAQRKRLQMFGDDMTQLQWNMRKSGWLPNPEQSSFYRSDEDFEKFAKEKCGSDLAKLKRFMTPGLLEKSQKASVHD